MNNSESTNTLEDNLEAPQISEETETRSILRKSFSEDISIFQSQEPLASPEKTSKIKSRSRLSSAFRSLRGSKSSDKASSLAIIGKLEKSRSSSGEVITAIIRKKSDTFDRNKLTPKDKNKKSKLVKKLSLSNIRKQKSKTNLQHILISSSTQTPSSLQRHTPEGGNLSISQISLIDLLTDGEEPESPVKFDKVRKIQITISGKKIESNEKNLPTATTSTSGEDYLSATTDPPIEEVDTKSHNRTGKGKTASEADNRNQGKINVTESTRDTPPRERAPPRPEVSSPRRGGNREEAHSTRRATVDSAKGAIRKTVHPKLQRQKSREDSWCDPDLLMSRDSHLERGRRYPRPNPIDHTFQGRADDQKDQSNSSGGNNIRNPNLSGAIVDHPLELPDDFAAEHRIEFSVGKAVRPPDTPVIIQSSIESKDFSSFGSNRSSGSQSPSSESSVHRRRIRYVGQPTFYTDEERDILEGKKEVTQLSGISEYSLDSDASIDHQMPAFGDLTMDHEEAPIMTSSSEKREHLYKILVIGELGTGKTSFIKRYVHQFFSQNYRATIGVDFALKVLHWDQNTIVRLQLWDIAGQERFGNMTRVYYKEAVGAFIVFDVTRSGTFDCVSKWKEDLDAKVQLPDGTPIPCILLANKCDQEKQGIVTQPEKMDEYVRANGFAGWFETSAKENINIEEAARALVNKILLNDKLISAADLADSEKFALAGGSAGSTASGKRSCSC